MLELGGYAPLARVVQLRTAQVERLPELQVRCVFSEEKAEEYAAKRRKGSKGPRVVVFRWGTRHLLVSGFHRLRSVELCGEKTVECYVIDGDLDAALLFSAQSNREHDGLTRTQEDKRRAILMLLDHPIFGSEKQWSNRKLADHCGVSEFMVRTWRRERLGAIKSQGRLGASGIAALAGQRKTAADPADATAAEHVRWRPTWLREARAGLEQAVRCLANLGDGYARAGVLARGALDELETAAVAEREKAA